MACVDYHILIIEDLPADRELYRRYLRTDHHCSYCFFETESAATGLALCRSQRVDAILLDYSLPDMDGLEFLQALHRQQTDQHPPVVMVTGVGNEQVAATAFKLGVEDYLIKSQLSPELLQLAIHSAIENTQLRQQLQESQAALLKANQQITTIWESMTDAFVALDRDWQITYVNQATARLNNLTPADIVGRNHWEMWSWWVGTIVESSFYQAVAEQVPVHFEAFYEPLQTWVEIHAYPSAEGLGVYFRDITNRKRTVLALAKSNERFELAAKAVDALIYDYDPRTGQVERSAALTKLFGYTQEEADPSADWWYQRLHPQDRAILEAAKTALMQTGNESYCLEYRVQHQNGHYVWVQDQGFLVRDPTGDVTRIVGSTIDITERKQAEAEREELLRREQAARAEAEAANRSKDEFVTMVAHELRAPLTAVSGWAQLLQARSYDPATTQRALETIRRSTGAQVQLVEDLLDISRLTRGKLQLKRVAVDLAPLLEATLNIARPQAEAKQILIHTSLTPTPQISGDLNRLQQILLNLLTNAIKFTPEGGRVEMGLRQEGSFALITITDTGKGVAPEFLPHLFELFQQGQPNTSARDGLGLGLTIVKNLVELHGGTITAESAGIGQGATFTVRLPLLEQSLPAGFADQMTKPVEPESLAR